MTLTRARFLQAAGLAAGAASLSGCSQVLQRLSRPGLPDRIAQAEVPAGDPAWRLLNRAAYGPHPGDLERLLAMGPDAWLEEQLAPDRIEENRAAWMRVALMDSLGADAEQAQELETAVFPEVGKGPVAVELQQATLLRAVYSARQLEQVMVEFWSDHFNITQLKGECSWLKTIDDRLIRRHAMGRFRDLVHASSRSPAMLFYLDNDKNRRRDPETGAGANENYARELLELHTLGVDGGYTLRDIQEVARCFSGWTYKRGFEPWAGETKFERAHHDDGPKTVLGVRIPAGQGPRDAEQVVELVCRHPSTARFVARKLCRRFVADRPSERLVARIAEVFTRTDGDIRQVLSVLLRTEEFRRGPSRKLKRPFDFAVSALRGLNADTDGAAVLPHLERMGHLPFKWTMPDGYPDRADAWTPSLLARWNFAVELVQGRIAGCSVDPAALVTATGRREPMEVCGALSRLLLGRALPAGTLAELAGTAGARRGLEEQAPQWLALILASPEFQWR